MLSFTYPSLSLSHMGILHMGTSHIGILPMGVGGLPYRDPSYGDLPYGNLPNGDLPYGDLSFGDLPYGGYFIWGSRRKWPRGILNKIAVLRYPRGVSYMLLKVTSVPIVVTSAAGPAAHCRA